MKKYIGSFDGFSLQNNYSSFHKDSVAKYLISPKGKYSALKAASKHRGVEFNLTIEEYIQLTKGLRNCAYCGNTLQIKKGSGFDRKDNTKGYFKENIADCCFDCNKLKSNKYSVEETKVMVRALNEYRKNKVLESVKEEYSASKIFSWEE